MRDALPIRAACAYALEALTDISFPFTRTVATIAFLYGFVAAFFAETQPVDVAVWSILGIVLGLLYLALRR